jgi:hypothetical protein
MEVKRTKAACRMSSCACADGFHLFKDGDAWAAVGPDFVDLQQSPAGFGATPEEAVKVLRVALRKAGYPDHSLPRARRLHRQGE